MLPLFPPLSPSDKKHWAAKKKVIRKGRKEKREREERHRRGENGFECGRERETSPLHGRFVIQPSLSLSLCHVCLSFFLALFFAYPSVIFPRKGCGVRRTTGWPSSPVCGNEKVCIRLSSSNIVPQKTQLFNNSALYLLADDFCSFEKFYTFLFFVEMPNDSRSDVDFNILLN